MDRRQISFSFFMIWFLSKEFDIGAQSAEASKFGGLGALFLEALGPSCLSGRQVLRVWLVNPHGKAIPAPLNCVDLLPSPHTTKPVSISAKERVSFATT